MNKEKLDEFRQTLLALRRDVAGGVTMLREQGVALGTDGTQDMADDAANTYTRQMLLGMSERERRNLREIDAALDRIDEGTYGVCEECQEPISEARLKALPYATLCVDCKADREAPP
ncbi:MAG: TraR/DksA family transcriptional regulator [Deltaproteobacteria bacterium]|nr:TraR/DksA family transcriptional regulator [Deltaproteobacteria bacterium]